MNGTNGTNGNTIETPDTVTDEDAVTPAAPRAGQRVAVPAEQVPNTAAIGACLASIATLALAFLLPWISISSLFGSVNEYAADGALILKLGGAAAALLAAVTVAVIWRANPRDAFLLAFLGGLAITGVTTLAVSAIAIWSSDTGLLGVNLNTGAGLLLALLAGVSTTGAAGFGLVNLQQQES